MRRLPAFRLMLTLYMIVLSFRLLWYTSSTSSSIYLSHQGAVFDLVWCSLKVATTLCSSSVGPINADSSCLFQNATWGQDLQTAVSRNTILISDHLLKSSICSAFSIYTLLWPLYLHNVRKNSIKVSLMLRESWIVSLCYQTIQKQPCALSSLL